MCDRIDCQVQASSDRSTDKSKDSRNASATSPAKGKADPNAVQITPLERMLENAGPLRNDGSDKFWGMENVCGINLRRVVCADF